jgi:S-adenosylmethionine/arginine decarboxylase-like enzyme
MKTEGRELSIVGWAADRMILGSEAKLKALLRGLCEVINMRVLGDMSFEVEVELSKKGKIPFEDEGGASALLCLSTSHIAIHGWPQRDVNRIDGALFRLSISSCRDFNSATVLQFLHFALHTTEVKVICDALVELP